MIRKATNNDCRILAELAVQMWEDNTVDSLEEEFSETIKTDDAVFFVEYENETPVGFAQCGLRKDYVEGTETSPVGYLEGIFVKEQYRNKGYAKELLSVCEKWARDMGCTEFASDCELDNVGSLKFHLAMGFEEVNRIICFRKGL